MTAGRVEAVCVVHALRDTGLRRVPVTAIDKRPVDGEVHVGESGLAGDRQCDTANHGGRYKAVYAYGDDEARRWAAELGRDLPVGWFGENLRVSGMSPTDACLEALGLLPFQINPHYVSVTLPGHHGETRDERRHRLVADVLVDEVDVRVRDGERASGLATEQVGRARGLVI